MENLKSRIINGETVNGCWLNLGSPLTAEIVGMAGFDWVLIDLEHGSGSEKDLLHQLQALQHTPATPIVRVESAERQRIHRALDMGAAGVMCPRVHHVEEATAVARALRYPPSGVRGVAKMVRATGFDWVLIDLEHGSGSEKDLLHQLQALQHTPATPIVRVESAERQRIHRALDMGAAGVMCPRVHHVEEATEVARALRYPPSGVRGVAKMVRATGFGQHFTTYWQHEDRNILGIVQIETKEILEHLDEVAALDEVDVLFIGPADLSMALGIFNQFEHPLFKEAVKATVAAANRAGKASGILLFNPEDFSTYHEMGIRMIACGADASFVAEGARRTQAELDRLRSALINPEGKRL